MEREIERMREREIERRERVRRAREMERRAMERSLLPCDYCGFASGSRKKCSCRAVRYCDDLCAQRDWPRHRDSCRRRALALALQRQGLAEVVIERVVSFVNWRM